MAVTRREFLAYLGGALGAGAVAGSVPLLRSWPQAAVVAGTAPRDAVCKEAWGARPLRPGLVGHTIERLTVHHTAVTLESNTRAPDRARQHQRFHQDAGWPDLAYHFLVDARGNVYEGRPVTARGDTFTDYDPSGHFLVACEGNFDAQELPAAQLDAAVDVLAWAATEFAVAPATIAGHRDYAATTCPGGGFYRVVANGEVRARVEARLDNGGVELVPLCGPAAADLVASIEAGTEPPPRPQTAGFHLRHVNQPGSSDVRFEFGSPGWVPLSGYFGAGP